MELVIQLVVWNGKKYLPYVLDSLTRQTFQDWHLMVFDNNSADGGAEWLTAHVPENGARYTLYTQSHNCGFAGGHNFLFRAARERFREASYVLLLNQDMFLEKECVERLMRFAHGHADAGAFAPRLMRWNFGAVERAAVARKDAVSEGTNSLRDYAMEGRTETVDTLGLKVFANRRVVDWMTGRTYTDEALTPYAKRRNDGAIEMFGVSGALPLYRVDALARALCGGELFDSDYGSYKEDVDLAWRLRLAGYRAFTVLDAVAYHDRTAAGPMDRGDVAARANDRTKPEYVRFQSYRNHLLTLFKNELWQNALIDAPHIFWYELKKCAYLLVRHTGLCLRVWREVVRLAPGVWRKRREVTRHKHVDWIVLRKWWDI